MLTLVLIFALNWTPVVNFWMGPMIYWHFKPCSANAFKVNTTRQEIQHWMVHDYAKLCEATTVLSTTLVNSTESQETLDQAKKDIQIAAPVVVLGGRFVLITLPLLVLQGLLAQMAVCDERFNICRRRRMNHVCDDDLMTCIARFIKVLFWIVSILIPPFIIFGAEISNWRLRWKFYNYVHADTSVLRGAANLDQQGMKNFRKLLLRAYISDVGTALKQAIMAWLTWFLCDLLIPVSGFGPSDSWRPQCLPTCLYYKRWKEPQMALGEQPDESDIEEMTDSDEDDEAAWGLKE